MKVTHIFWRKKGSLPGTPFLKGYLLGRCDTLVSIADNRYADNTWYKEDELEIVYDSMKND